jgi:hypothetical protein
MMPSLIGSLPVRKAWGYCNHFGLSHANYPMLKSEEDEVSALFQLSCKAQLRALFPALVVKRNRRPDRNRGRNADRIAIDPNVRSICRLDPSYGCCA